MNMDAPIHRPNQARLSSHQLALPLEMSQALAPAPLPPTGVAVLPQQVWASLPQIAQAQAQRTFAQVFREVVGDAAQR
jgi:hypothetical protein